MRIIDSGSGFEKGVCETGIVRDLDRCIGNRGEIIFLVKTFGAIEGYGVGPGRICDFSLNDDLGSRILKIKLYNLLTGGSKEDDSGNYIFFHPHQNLKL